MTTRKGLTLIEVMMALTILACAMLSMAGYLTKFARTIAASDVLATANEIAADQLEAVKAAPRYAAIDTLYAGTTVMTGTYAGYTRVTTVTHTGGGSTDLYDYRTITVTVSNSRLSKPVSKTSIIAAF
jgi:prepilin-type N-terminal cleavage/methylation domain-containing protein